MTQLSSHKKALKQLAILFVIIVVILKIVFYKELTITILKLVLASFWLFIIPGHILLLGWKEKLGFSQRFIIGTAIAAVIIGTASYYFGLIGLNLRYHIYFLPVILIIIGGYLHYKNEQRRVRQD